MFLVYVRFVCVQCLPLSLILGILAWSVKRVTASFNDTPKRVLHAFFGHNRDGTELARTYFELMRGILVFCLALSIYTNLKIRIPLVNPWMGDTWFVRWDQMLFGSLPHMLEAWWRDHPAVASSLGNVYLGGYRGVVILGLFFVMRFEARHLRVLFMATAVTYLVCIFVTLACPSVGPCFMDAGRFAWLGNSEIGEHQQALLEYQTLVIERARSGMSFVPRPFAGIAAFPSLHVGNLVVVLFLALRYCRVAVPFVAYFLLGTVLAATAFGWHYCVDYLAGGLIAVVMVLAVEAMVPRCAGEASPTTG